MGKILRKTAFVFAESSGPNQVAQFGSLANGTPNFTLDPAVIQALSKWRGGWFPSVLGNNSPAIEDMNAYCYVMAYQMAYQLQQGIPEYDAATIYFIDSFCSFNGKIYISLTDNNTGNQPDTAGTDWLLFQNQIWGGTDAGQVNGYSLPAVPGFPANAAIPPGTILSFIASSTCTGDSTLSVNAQSNLIILDSDGYTLQYGMIARDQKCVLVYNGSQWNLVNARRKRREWRIDADYSGASPTMVSTGIGTGNYGLTGTGGSIGPLAGFDLGVPSIYFTTDATSGHKAIFTTTNRLLPFYALMDLFMHGAGLILGGGGGASQAFVGYAYSEPILNAADPLALIPGWGLWFNWNNALKMDVSFVNNGFAAAANSTITPIVANITGAQEYWCKIKLDGGEFTCEFIINGTQYVVTSNTNIPTPTSPNVNMYIAPFIAVRTNANKTAAIQMGEMYGTYGL